MTTIAPFTMQEQVKPRRSYGTFLSLYFAALFLWGFDYKAEAAGAGALVQVPIFAFHILITTSVILICGRGKKTAFFVRAFVAAAFFFLIGTSLVGLLNEQPLWDVMVNTIPLLVFITTAMATYILLSCDIDLTLFRKRLQNFCLLFILTHFAIVLALGNGINLATSRYAYLSGAAIPACAVLVMGFFIRFGLREVILSLSNLIIILISVTRTELAIIAGQVASVFAVSPSIFFGQSSVKKITAVFLLVAAIIGTDVVTGTGLSGRWIERLVVHSTAGADPTALTRIAENNYMLQNFMASPEQMLWGNGIAAPTQLIGREATLAASLIGSESVNTHSKGFGHNNYISLLFSGGLVFGAPLLALIICSGFQSLALMRKLTRSKTLNEPFAYIGIWGSLIILGMMMSGLLGGTFADRTTCLWYGVGLGMFCWARETVRRMHMNKDGA